MSGRGWQINCAWPIFLAFNFSAQTEIAHLQVSVNQRRLFILSTIIKLEAQGLIERSKVGECRRIWGRREVRRIYSGTTLRALQWLEGQRLLFPDKQRASQLQIITIHLPISLPHLDRFNISQPKVPVSDSSLHNAASSLFPRNLKNRICYLYRKSLSAREKRHQSSPLQSVSVGGSLLTSTQAV